MPPFEDFILEERNFLVYDQLLLTNDIDDTVPFQTPVLVKIGQKINL